MKPRSKEELSELVRVLSTEAGTEEDSDVIYYSFEVTNKETKEVHHIYSKTRSMSIALMELYNRWKKDDDLNLFEMELLSAHMGLAVPRLYDYHSVPVIDGTKYLNREG